MSLLSSEDDSTAQGMQRVRDNNSITDGSAKRHRVSPSTASNTNGSTSESDEAESNQVEPSHVTTLKPKRKPKPKKKQKIPTVQIGNVSPIIFLTLKLLIDKHNGGTDRIVNVDAFVKECGRMLESYDLMEQAMGVSAESLGFKLHRGQKSTGKRKRFENADGGLSFQTSNLINGLKTRLFDFKEHPNLVEEHWTGVPNVTITMCEGVRCFRCTLTKFRDGKMPRVMSQHANNNVDDRSETNGVGVACRNEDGSGNQSKSFRVHHILLCALDPMNDLFEPVHKFTAFCGCCNRGDRAFTRPRVNCHDVQETFDQDGDALSAVCKTDADHTLGCDFNSCWSLWKAHHAVNQQMHHVRKRAGDWLHPCIKETYGKEQEDRARPSFFKSSPNTLSQEWRAAFGICD